MKSHFLFEYFVAAVVIMTPLSCVFAQEVFAYVASSASYRIQQDSVNTGGVPVSSASYNMENTVGEIGTGVSDSASYKVKAGYQQMAGGSISITSPADVTTSRGLSLTDNTATGSTTWTVTAETAGGYTLSVTTEAVAGCNDHDGQGVPDALCDVATGEAFDDLATTSKTTWSVSGTYGFGWSAYGDDTTGHGSGSACDAGDTHTPSATLTYQGFDGTNTSYEIASSTSGTAGTDTTLCFAVEQEGVLTPAGDYNATTTATALSN